MNQYTGGVLGFRFQVRCSRAVRAKAAHERVSARIAQAAWLACRFPPRVTRGISSSRDFGRTGARRRKPKDAERAERTGYFQREASARTGCRSSASLRPAERARERTDQP